MTTKIIDLKCGFCRGPAGELIIIEFGGQRWSKLLCEEHLADLEDGARTVEVGTSDGATALDLAPRQTSVRPIARWRPRLRPQGISE